MSIDYVPVDLKSAKCSAQTYSISSILTRNVISEYKYFVCMRCRLVYKPQTKFRPRTPNVIRHVLDSINVSVVNSVEKKSSSLFHDDSTQISGNQKSTGGPNDSDTHENVRQQYNKLLA